MPLSSSSSSTQRNTALAFLQTFEHLDSSANLALRAPNCRHTIAPTSLHYTPDMTNEQWAAHFASLKQVLAAFPVTATEIFEAEGSGGKQVTVWATSDATFREEGKGEDDEAGVEWGYQGEYIFIFGFDKTGEKIERIVEFVDSAKVLEVRGLIERAKRNLAVSRGGSSGDSIL